MEEEKNVSPEQSEGGGSDDNGSQTREVKIVGAKKPAVMLYSIIGLLVAVLAVMGYFLFFANDNKDVDEIGGGVAQVRQMQELTRQVHGLESELKEKENELFNLVEDYKQKTGQESLDFNALRLEENEKEILEQLVIQEKDLSVKALLQEILEKNNEISEFQRKIAEIEALLPRPHIVVKDENHYKIAMDFLVNEKRVDKKQALVLVERTALLDQLVPGFKVWNFYTGDTYGTSVTQGSAAISPNTLIRRVKKKLVDARDEAIGQRDQLAEDIKSLEERRRQLVHHLDSLTKEKESLITKVGELNQQVNSLFYLMDWQRNLKKKGILKGGFLKSTKLRDVSPDHFVTSIDLRARNQIIISAPELGMKKIKKLTLYPRFYRAGADYHVEITPDQQSATVTFLETSKFKNERVVISVK